MYMKKSSFKFIRFKNFFLNPIVLGDLCIWLISYYGVLVNFQRLFFVALLSILNLGCMKPLNVIPLELLFYLFCDLSIAFLYYQVHRRYYSLLDLAFSIYELALLGFCCRVYGLLVSSVILNFLRLELFV